MYVTIHQQCKFFYPHTGNFPILLNIKMTSARQRRKRAAAEDVDHEAERDIKRATVDHELIRRTAALGVLRTNGFDKERAQRLLDRIVEACDGDETKINRWVQLAGDLLLENDDNIEDAMAHHEQRIEDAVRAQAVEAATVQIDSAGWTDTKMVRCPRCHQYESQYMWKQTKSVDEPACMFWRCLHPACKMHLRLIQNPSFVNHAYLKKQ